jgi:aspartate/glutamate racemase
MCLLLSKVLLAKELELFGTFRFHEEFQWAVQALASGKVTVDPILSALVPRCSVAPGGVGRSREIIEGFQAREGIDGLILGGTELPLLLRSGPAPAIPYLDNTKLHVERVVTEMLS